MLQKQNDSTQNTDNVIADFSSNGNDNRDLSIDVIRSIATIMVVVIHASASGFYSIDMNWNAVNFYDSMSRVAVPLFFMVSGSLLLTRKHAPVTIAKRIWKISIPLFAWSLVYIKYKTDRGMVVGGSWIISIFTKPVTPHLWFLYSMIGAYLFLPVLSAFFQNSSKGNHMLFLGCWFVGACLVPAAARFVGPNVVGLDLSFFALYGGYIFLGVFLTKEITTGQPYWIFPLLIWIVSVALLIYLTATYSKTNPDEYFYSYSSPIVAIGAMAFFIFLKSFIANNTVILLKFAPLFKNIASASFGIYLVHVLIIEIFSHNHFRYSSGGAWFGIPVLSVATFIVAYVLVRLIQHLPYLRRVCPTS